MLNESKVEEIVGALSQKELDEYHKTADQFLFADEICTRNNFDNSEINVEMFEYALDCRVGEMNDRASTLEIMAELG